MKPEGLEAAAELTASPTEGATREGATRTARSERLRVVPLRALGLANERSSAGAIAADRRGYRMRRLLALGDSAVIVAAVLLLQLVDGPLGMKEALGLPLAMADPLAFGIAAVLAWVAMAAISGAYHADERRIEHSVADEVGKLVQLSAAWAWTLLLGQSVLTEGAVSVAPIVALWLVVVCLILIARAAVRAFAQGRTWYRQAAFLVGTPTDTERVGALFERHPEFGIEVARRIELSEASGTSRVRQLIEGARETGVARVIFASSYEGLDERTGALRFLAEEGIKVDLVPGDSEVFRSDAELHFIEGLPILTLPTTGRPRSAAAVKRAIDIVGAGACLLMFSPVFAYCAIRIKLDSPGPVFFRQLRDGRKGEPFEVLKFRTMVADAEGSKDSVRRLNRRTDGMFKVADDPRITRFGARLRASSLDELPQLINVLRGEMSLVGPRPLIRDETVLVEDHYRARFDVKPGITGPWQVFGRSNIPFQKMVKLDYAYVINWSIGDDLKLLMRTASAISHRRGAY